MGRKRTNFSQSAKANNYTFYQYRSRLKELSLSMFQWNNVPDTIDVRYLELQLYENGSAIWFRDEVIGDLALSVAFTGAYDVYGNPLNRRAYSRYNGYSHDLTLDDSVVIWNNYLRLPSAADINMYARRLSEIDRIIDVNVRAQKTPVLVQGNEQQRLTLLNLYKEYDGNSPVIFGDKNLDINALKAIKTDAPYISDRLYELKTQIWNEALTYLGISNVNIVKKERMITDEVQRNQGGTVSSRYSRLEMRRKAADEINKMFGLNISVDYREDLDLYDTTEGEPEPGGGEPSE